MPTRRGRDNPGSSHSSAVPDAGWITGDGTEPLTLDRLPLAGTGEVGRASGGPDRRHRGPPPGQPAEQHPERGDGRAAGSDPAAPAVPRGPYRVPHRPPDTHLILLRR